MGCGKSSVGRKLSQLLCCPFMDLDSYIEEISGRSIPEIFATDGESCFRKMELEALREITRGRTSSDEHSQSMILALGGGTVMTAECAEIVNKETTCIYLKASADTLISHLEGETAHRPMLHGESLRERISVLMDQRSATYENTAHIIIDTDGKSIDEIAAAIMNQIR